jgi:hypothetical protein
VVAVNPAVLCLAAGGEFDTGTDEFGVLETGEGAVKPVIAFRSVLAGGETDFMTDDASRPAREALMIYASSSVTTFGPSSTPVRR